MKRSKTPSTGLISVSSPLNFDESGRKTAKKTTTINMDSYSPSKRDLKIKNFVGFKEDLDFFIKNKGVLDDELVFLNELSQIEHFDENYIQDTIKLLKKDDKNLLKVQNFVKSKADFEALKKEADGRKISYKISENERKKLKSQRFSVISRNNFLPNENIQHEGSEDDTSLPSITEATLDGLYSQSLSLQKNLQSKKTKNFANKIKQFLKLQEIAK